MHAGVVECVAEVVSNETDAHYPVDKRFCWREQESRTANLSSFPCRAVLSCADEEYVAFCRRFLSRVRSRSISLNLAFAVSNHCSLSVSFVCWPELSIRFLKLSSILVVLVLVLRPSSQSPTYRCSCPQWRSWASGNPDQRSCTAVFDTPVSILFFSSSSPKQTRRQNRFVSRGSGNHHIPISGRSCPGGQS